MDYVRLYSMLVRHDRIYEYARQRKTMRGRNLQCLLLTVFKVIQKLPAERINHPDLDDDQIIRPEILEFFAGAKDRKLNFDVVLTIDSFLRGE